MKTLIIALGIAITTHNYEQPQSDKLVGTVWISPSELGGYDSLVFTSATQVSYYLEEVTWTFSSTYSVDDSIITVETKTYELEVENPDKYPPNLRQKYKINMNELKLIYQARDRKDGWKEDSEEWISRIADFKRIK